jgi:carboxyl-terminal processing protease
MIRFNLFLLVALGISLALRAETPAGQSSYPDWAATGLEWKHLSALLTNTSCYENDLNFEGCYEASNMALSLLTAEKPGDQIFFFGTRELLNLTGIASEVSIKESKTFGSWRIIEVPRPSSSEDSSVPTPQRASDRRHLRDKKHKIFKAIYDSFKVNLALRPSFDDYCAWLSEKFSRENPGVLKRAIALSLTAFLNVRDPWAELDTFQKVTTTLYGSRITYFGVGIKPVQSPNSKDFFARFVFPGSPADLAGIRPGDFIEQVDSFRVQENSNIDEVIGHLRASEASLANLSIRRNSEHLNFKIQRREYQPRYVLEQKLPTKENQSIADFKIIRFVEGVCKDVYEVLKTAESSPDALGAILDLRNNGGGLLKEAACVAGLFVGHDQVVLLRQSLAGGQTGQPGREKVFSDLEKFNIPTGFRFSKPVVILVNEGTASAAEIVAGAVREYASKAIESRPNALLVGSPTFGKGLIQTYTKESPFRFLASLPDLRLRYKKTEEFYVLPSGKIVDGVGIVPEMIRGDSPDMNLDHTQESAGVASSRRRKVLIEQIEDCTKTGPENPQDLFLHRNENGLYSDYPLMTAVKALKCLEAETQPQFVLGSSSNLQTKTRD